MDTHTCLDMCEKHMHNKTEHSGWNTKKQKKKDRRYGSIRVHISFHMVIIQYVKPTYIIDKNTMNL